VNVTRSLLKRALGLTLFLLVVPVHGAPSVVVGLNEIFQVTFGTPPPSPEWAAIIDPTLSKVTELFPQTGGPAVAADVHGHRAYVVGGGGITVIYASLNRIEAVIVTAPFDPIFILVADPVRTLLYATSDFGQPHIQVIDTNALGLLPPISLPSWLPQGNGVSSLVVAEDGTRLFVLVANILLTVRLPDGQVIQSVTLDFTPSALALNQDRNELYVAEYGGPRIFVLAADSLVVQRNLTGFGSIGSIVVRPGDGALLVESGVPDSTSSETQVDAVNVVTGQVLATSSPSADVGGLVMSIDGKQGYRFQRGNLTSGGGSYSDTSSSWLVVMDALTLQYTGSIPLDTRAENDPSRQGSAIVARGAASIPLVTPAVEYFDAALGHYFTTSIPAEIAALDGGMFPGWQRSGETLLVYAQRGDGPAGTTPVCRFYGLPQKGLDSHFYSASPAECAAVEQKFGYSWLLESSDVFDVYPADAATGACPFETTPVYRVYNNRSDANHRYTTSLDIRDSMVQMGWIPEGYGPDAVAFCVPR